MLTSMPLWVLGGTASPPIAKALLWMICLMCIRGHHHGRGFKELGRIANTVGAPLRHFLNQDMMINLHVLVLH